MAFSISAWRRWSASSSRVSPSRSVMKPVIAVAGEEGQLGTGRGLHPPDDEPHWGGFGLALEVGIEAAVGPHRELSPGPSMAHPAHGLPQEVGGAPNSVGLALAQPRHQHLSGAGGDGQQRVIAPLASVTMVTRPSLASP